MQRFKAEWSKEKTLPHHNRMRLCTGPHGRFAYGANGTLTQAARWRAEVIQSLEDMGATRKGASVTWWHMNLAALRHRLDSARLGGWRLPS